MAKRKRKPISFQVYLPPEAYEALLKLKKLAGKRTLAETIKAALKLYMSIDNDCSENASGPPSLN